jgi:purine-binding chemotaxis protein CheW
MSANQNAKSSDVGQVLTFMLGEETFGMGILRVREIRGWQQVTAIPESPEYVLGVLNLRGAIVPVIDLRKRMAMTSIGYTATTVIIVVSTETKGGRNDIGLVVDSVSDVADLNQDAIQDVPDVGNEQRTEYIRGIVTMGSNLMMLLDIDRFMQPDSDVAFESPIAA